MPHAPRTLVRLVLLTLALAVPAFATTGVLTPEMVVDLRQVQTVALSPAGDRIAYTLQVQRSADDDPGRAYTQLWVVGAEGDPRQFTSGEERVSSPDWSPDGKRISFLLQRASVSEETQIFAIPADGGEARALTDHPSSVSAYAWAPDGKTIAFVAPVPDDEESKKRKKSGWDQKVDGDVRRSELWLHDTESGESAKLLDTLQVWNMVWAPDAKTLVVQASENARTDDSMLFAQIWAVPVAGGEPRKIIATPGKLGEMEVSPDGRYLAYLAAVSANDPIAQTAFLVPLSGGTARNLTEDYKGSASELAWIDDRNLLLGGVEGETNRFYRMDASNGRRQELPWNGTIVRGRSIRRQSGRVAYAAHTAAHPAEVFLGEIGAVPERRTFHNPELEGVRLARQEVVSWTGADGWEIHGVLTYPLDFRVGVRYPLVLQIHGGPEGVSLDGWTTNAGYPVQLLARDGFMVLQPNYRGSMGRGVAFSKADHDDLGGKEFQDVLAGIDALVDRGLVDRERVGTGGWSYGGYFSAWAATRHSDRFKASIVGAGLTNWISFAGTTDIPYEMSVVHWDSWWQDEPELHWQRSPVAHMDKAQTPTLIVHGENDARVHPEQGIQLYTALRIKGVPTSLVLYPREPHGLTERAHELDFIDRALGWFGEHVGTSAKN